jgi:hypothetical protein
MGIGGLKLSSGGKLQTGSLRKLHGNGVSIKLNISVTFELGQSLQRLINQHVDIRFRRPGTVAPHHLHDHVIPSQQGLLVNAVNVLVNDPNISAMAQK